jgi:O-antigen/teichoic acid export membrane protein
MPADSLIVATSALPTASRASFFQLLVRASIVLVGAHFWKMAAIMVRNKVLAVSLGPQGVGVISQVSGVVDIVNLTCMFGLADAVARYLAASHARGHAAPFTTAPTEQPSTLDAHVPVVPNNWQAESGRIVRVGLALILRNALLGMIFMLLLQRPLAHAFLSRADYAPFIVIAALCVPFAASYQFVAGVFQGMAKVRAMGVQGMAFATLSLVCAVILTLTFGLWGGVWALLSTWALAAGISWFLLSRDHLLELLHGPRHEFLCGLSPWRVHGDHVLRHEKQRLLKFGGVAFVSALAFPLTAVGVRGTLLHWGGGDAAGLFQVPMALSVICFHPLLYAVGTWVAPQIGRVAEQPQRVQAVLNHTLRLALLFIVPASLLLMVARVPFVTVLFSSRFLPAVEMMPWQLVGDFFRAMVWWLALPLMATHRYRASLLCDGSGILLSIVFAMLLVPQVGLPGATLSGALAQMLIAVPLGIYRRRTDGLHLPPGLRMLAMLSALAVVSIALAGFDARWYSAVAVCLACWVWQALRSHRASRLAE